MSDITASTSAVQHADSITEPDEAQLAAASFLARFATRPHIEVFRSSMEQRGLAPSTIDRRLSTVCVTVRPALAWAGIEGGPPPT